MTASGKKSAPEITISLCMIVKNEAATIERCLRSAVKAVDEIIIVDTGSTDQTKEIVRQFTDKIYDFPWIDDFAAARNAAFRHATKEYILWLDADDILLPNDLEKLLLLKQTADRTVDSYIMHYNVSFDESGNVVSTLGRNRLVKRSKQFQWVGAVHECLVVGGKIAKTEISITHRKEHQDTHDRNLMIYEKRLAKGENFSPRDLYYYANELNDHHRYEDAITYYQKALDTQACWVEDNISICGKLADCYSTLGDDENKLRYTYLSFNYDMPRAEFCCRLGYHFLGLKKYQQAIFWYTLATTLQKPKDSLAVLNNACWTWLPHLQLCLCYATIGEIQSAIEHNKIAESYVPNHPSIVHNNRYFAQLAGSSS